MSHHAQSHASTSTLRPLSADDDGIMHTAPPAEVIAASQTIQQIKGSLGDLGVSEDLCRGYTVARVIPRIAKLINAYS